jgi:hypothetical protein
MQISDILQVFVFYFCHWIYFINFQFLLNNISYKTFYFLIKEREKIEGAGSQNFKVNLVSLFVKNGRTLYEHFTR